MTLPPALRRSATLVGLVMTMLAALLVVAPASQAAEPLVVTGTVKNAAGRPLEGMAVVLSRANGSHRTETVTLADGSFSVRAAGEGPPPGLQVLSVTDPSQRLDPFTSKGFTAENVPPFAVRLTATKGMLQGRIDPRIDGTSVVPVGRRTFVLELVESRPELISTPYTVTTADDGAFTLPYVPPGAYRLRFSGLVGTAPWMSGPEPFDDVHYQGRCWGRTGAAKVDYIDCAAASRFEVSKGRITQLGTVKFVHHDGILSGTLTDQLGQAVPDGRVSFHLARGAHRFVASVDVRDGQWVKGDLPRGTYIIRSEVDDPWVGGADAESATRFVVADNTDVRDIHVTSWP